MVSSSMYVQQTVLSNSVDLVHLHTKATYRLREAAGGAIPTAVVLEPHPVPVLCSKNFNSIRYLDGGTWRI